MASYATPADMMQRFDARTIGMLVADGNTKIDEINLGQDPNLLTMLADASGEIETHLIRGGRYVVADLVGLTGNSLNYLTRICCEVAMYMLWERRAGRFPDQSEAAAKIAQDRLGRLAAGEDVFNLAANVSASTPVITGPSTIALNRLNSIASQTRGKVYPNWRLPNNR